ncbi:MAG: ABC transporter permease subunit [Defluviitaleaceae bacterium]|nr:ABC transporter permease subunit [Defluviitaleaceae bacterium]MCL2275887.1 ABC transporter permease subunit [Defluviitaleaceae bacterium]
MNDTLAVPLRKKPWYIRLLRQWDLQLLVIPPILYILVFNYIPMYGIIMAFQEFRLGDTMGMSEWVGLQHFRDLWADPNFPRAMRNNIVMGLMRIVIGFPLPIIFAIMLNELRSIKFKKTTQTISYLPHFISWPAAGLLIITFLHVDNGTMNNMLMSMGIISEPIGFFIRSEYFWGIFIVTHIWKVLGWEAIIFVAAITGIDQELYEAASIDGASRLQKIWYITVQGIKPTIIILFILTIGSLMSTSFDQIMNLTNMMSNTMLRERAEILQTYVFRTGIGQRRFSFASAVGLLNTVINFILLLSANWISRKWSETSLF